MKTYICIFILGLITMMSFQADIAYSSESQKSAGLIGLWSNTVPSTNASGEPCPFVPETLEFHKDHTMTMPEFGVQRLPYKTAPTKGERATVEKRFPDLKGKSLLLILPNPSMSWGNTPMVYAYSISNGELTLVLQNWSPAKFVKKAK